MATMRRDIGSDLRPGRQRASLARSRPAALRERCALIGLTLAFGAGMGCHAPVRAQVTLPDATGQAPLTESPPRSGALRVQPSITVQATATDNAAIDANGDRQSDLIVSVVPGLGISAHGAHTRIEGQFGLNALHYVHGTQSDQTVPTGYLKLNADAWEHGAGIDASITASQVKSSFATRNTDTPTTANTYNNTLLRISPYVDKPLTDLTSLRVRLDRGWLRTSELSSNLTPRPGTQLSDHKASLARRPTPLGYELAWRYQDTRISGQGDPVLTQRTIKAAGLYALNDTLELGLTAGRESTDVLVQSFKDTIHGWRVHWRPSPRTDLRGEVENRFFGKGWNVDFNHRMPWLAWNLTLDRNASTSGESLGTVAGGGALRDLFDAMLTTRIPNDVERQKAVNDLIARRNLPQQAGTARDVYNLSAQLRQTIAGKVSYMGRRNVVSMAAGLVKTRPLLTQVVLSADQAYTKEYYLDSQINHQLTPASNVSTGLRWSRAYSLPSVGAAVYTRDLSLRATFNTTLSPQSDATLGVRRQLTNSTAVSNGNESAMFVGLGYRF